MGKKNISLLLFFFVNMFFCAYPMYLLKKNTKKKTVQLTSISAQEAPGMVGQLVVYKRGTSFRIGKLGRQFGKSNIYTITSGDDIIDCCSVGEFYKYQK